MSQDNNLNSMDTSFFSQIPLMASLDSSSLGIP